MNDAKTVTVQGRFLESSWRSRRGHDRIIGGFITTYAKSVYNH